MADGSQRPRCAQVFWCLWFALLMTAPYPAGTGELWFIGFGAVSESKVFAYVAAGVVAGLWVATLPRAERFLLANRRGRAVTVAFGVLVSALTLMAVWVNLFFMLYLVPEYAQSWTATVRGGASVSWGMEALYSLGHLPMWTALLSGFLCGCSAIALFRKRTSHTAADSLSHVGGHSLACCALCFALGLLQAPAWVLLMPHAAEFPQRLPEVDSIGSIWDSPSMGTGLFALVVPLIVLSTLVLVATFNGDGKASGQAEDMACGAAIGRHGLFLVALYCLGVIAYRLVVRIDPGLIRISFAASALCLALYVAMFALACIALRHHGRCSVLQADLLSQPVSEPLPAFLDVPPSWRQALVSYGLSEKEMIAVRACELGLTAAQTADALGIAEPTVREYRRRSRVKMHVSSMDDAVKLVRSSLSASGDTGITAECGDAYVLQEPRLSCHGIWSVYLPGISLFSLMLSGCLMLFPIDGAVTEWSDVWTTGFGLACGLILAWSCLMVLGLPAFELHKNAVAVCATVAAGQALCVFLVVGMQSGMLAFLPGPAHRATYTVGIATALCCLVVSFRLLLWLRHEDGDDRRVFAICAVAAAAFAGISGAGVAAWAISIVGLVALHIITLFVLLVHATRGQSPNAHERHGFKPPFACRAAWSLVAGMVMWTWGEIWRSQGFESSVLLLQCCVAVLLLIAICRLYVLSLLDMRQILALACQFAVLLYARGLATAVVVSFVVLTMRIAAIDGVDKRYQCGYAWHSGLLAGAFCLIVGTLATNYAGYVKVASILEALGAAYDSGLLVGAATLAISLLVVVLFVLEAASGEEVSLSLEGEARVKTALLARGLSDNQVCIALLLARGFTVGEVAEQLNYSRSTVTLARRVVYSALGVTDRGSLGVALRTLSGN